MGSLLLARVWGGGRRQTWVLSAGAEESLGSAGATRDSGRRLAQATPPDAGFLAPTDVASGEVLISF